MHPLRTAPVTDRTFFPPYFMFTVSLTTGDKVLNQFCMWCNFYVLLDTNIHIIELTRAEQLPHAQIADGQPHDGGFVQVGSDIVWQGKLVR